MDENKMTVYVQYTGQSMQFEFCLLHKNEYGFDKVYACLLSKFNTIEVYKYKLSTKGTRLW